ncbi:HAD family hydrolase [Desulfohalovibrio reitneri]|uniref:HAD family hydrolase n=1 Tax=Desulfohalovibrio reitneri TaxID=1307759 RepID=UPI0004A6D1DA|nr:HAD family hydrolase [Desulfohalovibrio reitneri]
MILLFDFDGTLFDTMPSIIHATRETFRRAGLAEPAEAAIRGAIRDGRGLEYYLGRLNPDIAKPDMPDWVLSWRAVYDAEAHALSRPFPGAVEAVARLHGLGAKVAVVSNKGEPALLRSVKEAGFGPFVSAVAGDAPPRPKKPNPQMYRQAILPAFYGEEPGRVVMVGDSAADLEFGRNIDARVVWAAYGYGDPAACLAMNPDVVLDSPADLADLMVT